MPSPSTVLTTQRPDLPHSYMEFSNAANQKGFIAHRVLPISEVAKQAGNFGKIPVEELLQNRDTARTPGSGYSRGEWTFLPATYSCEEHGAEEPIDDSERKIYGEYFDSDMIAASRAFAAVLGNAEARVAAAVFNATTWTSNTTAVTEEWDTVSAAIPAADILAAKRSMFAVSGLEANALIINRNVFDNIKLLDSVTEVSQAQNFMDMRAGTISEQGLALILGIDEIIVAGAAKNTANENQTGAFSRHWSDEYAMVAKIAKTEDFREPAIGRTFHWGEDGSSIGGTVETYREEQTRSDIFRVRHQVDEVITHVEAGWLLSNVTTI